ncbi:hypothetical protein F2P81_002992 [Scophthalmus maximus]|uniref:Uncharacterized protein n=1 Tax=Scophthalmus maximus TaxID=52904 RepID=A0A6A4TKU6_SCOMX|nr:hypothetical protein F2P81_002992 [Scophthalmus maximus]
MSVAMPLQRAADSEMAGGSVNRAYILLSAEYFELPLWKVKATVCNIWQLHIRATEAERARNYPLRLFMIYDYVERCFLKRMTLLRRGRLRCRPAQTHWRLKIFNNNACARVLLSILGIRVQNGGVRGKPGPPM